MVVFIISAVQWSGSVIYIYRHSCSVVSDSLWPHGLQPQTPLSMGILQARILELIAMPFSRGSSQSRDQTQVSALQVDSLLSEPPDGKKNTFRVYTDTHICTYILKVFFLHAKRHSFNLKLTLKILNEVKGNKIPHFKLTFDAHVLKARTSEVSSGKSAWLSYLSWLYMMRFLDDHDNDWDNKLFLDWERTSILNCVK